MIQNQLIVAQGPTIPSLQAWQRSFVSVTLTDGRTECRRPLTEAERAETERMISAVRSVLRPAPIDQMMAVLAKLLLAFPSQDVSEATMKYRSESYATALRDFPAWAIGKGSEMWLKRQFPEGNENYAFAPSPPQLSRLCQIAVREARAREVELQKILNAKPEVIVEATQSEALRRAERVKRAFQSLGMGPAPEAPLTEPVVSEMAAPSPELLGVLRRPLERTA